MHFSSVTIESENDSKTYTEQSQNRPMLLVRPVKIPKQTHQGKAIILNREWLFESSESINYDTGF